MKKYETFKKEVSIFLGSLLFLASMTGIVAWVYWPNLPANKPITDSNLGIAFPFALASVTCFLSAFVLLITQFFLFITRHKTYEGDQNLSNQANT